MLSSMSTYLLSLFWIPNAVLLRVENIQRDFLWGGSALEKKTHNVNWKIVCPSRGKGGLRVERLATFNKGLLCKWCWRFSIEHNTLWKAFITLKYGAEVGGCFTKACMGELWGGPMGGNKLRVLAPEAQHVSCW